MASAAPGWYPDPEQPGHIRYWEGQRWSDYRLPSTGAKVGQGATQSSWFSSHKGVTIVAAIVLLLAIIGATTDDEDPALDYAADTSQTTGAAARASGRLRYNRQPHRRGR